MVSGCKGQGLYCNYRQLKLTKSATIFFVIYFRLRVKRSVTERLPSFLRRVFQKRRGSYNVTPSAI